MSVCFRRLRLGSRVATAHAASSTTSLSSSSTTTMFACSSLFNISSSVVPAVSSSRCCTTAACSSSASASAAASTSEATTTMTASSSSSSSPSSPSPPTTSSSSSSVTLDDIKPLPWEADNNASSPSSSAARRIGDHPAEYWAALGKEVLAIARGCDAGPAAFEDALIAREQLETMIEGAGYGSSMRVAVFGGAVVNGLLELGGDVDFVAVCEQEPSYADAAQAVVNIARQLRRLGLRSQAVPRARVPLVKTDRVSSAPPGSSVNLIASNAVFRYMRAATQAEQSALESALKEQFGATRLEWNGGSTLVAQFPSTSEAVRAIAWTKKCGQLDIPLRLPVDPKHGPEIYRYTFDLCLSSSGLQNSHLFNIYLSYYPFGRHLVLFLKRWARACGIINTHDGMLSSYALNVMVIHFLVRVGVIPALQLEDANDPQSLPTVPEYTPLEDVSAGDVATLGFLAAHYFDYYAHVFKYDSQVVCTTTARELDKSVLRWGVAPSKNNNNNNDTSASSSSSDQQKQPQKHPTKPPYFSFCIKDPYNTENIARNINHINAKRIQSMHDVALQILAQDGNKPRFVAAALIDPNGPAVTALKHQSQQQGGSGVHGGGSKNSSSNKTDQPAALEVEALSPEAEARREITKMVFETRQDSLNRVGEATARSHEQTRAAQDLTRSIVSWMQRAEPQN